MFILFYFKLFPLITLFSGQLTEPLLDTLLLKDHTSVCVFLGVLSPEVHNITTDHFPKHAVEF